MRRLKEPENMTAAIDAKCHAYNQIGIMEDRQKKLTKDKKFWKKRYEQCLQIIGRYAVEASKATNRTH